MWYGDSNMFESIAGAVTWSPQLGEMFRRWKEKAGLGRQSAKVLPQQGTWRASAGAEEARRAQETPEGRRKDMEREAVLSDALCNGRH